MATKEQIDSTVQRIAVAAFLHYPDITTDDPTYSIADEVSWCLEELDESSREIVRELTTQAIADPTRYRESLYGLLFGLRE